MPSPSRSTSEIQRNINAAWASRGVGGSVAIDRWRRARGRRKHIHRRANRSVVPSSTQISQRRYVWIASLDPHFDDLTTWPKGPSGRRRFCSRRRRGRPRSCRERLELTRTSKHVGNASPKRRLRSGRRLGRSSDAGRRIGSAPPEDSHRLNLIRGTCAFGIGVCESCSRPDNVDACAQIRFAEFSVSSQCSIGPRIPTTCACPASICIA